jgi:hypothetical protein
MKYQTFVMVRRAVIAALVVVAGGAGVMCFRSSSSEDPAESKRAAAASERQRMRTEAATQPLMPIAPRVAPVTTPTPTAALPAIDQEVMAVVARTAVQAKVKDASQGKPYKVNLYSDDGKRFNRAKVDLDRDEKWDESWSFGANGSIEKQVSDNDNDKYDRTLYLLYGQWSTLATAAPPAPTPAATPVVAATQLPAIDQDVIALVGRTPVQEKIKDATKGKPYKVNLYSDDGKRFNRAKVDLDRDDKWDESWTFDETGGTEKKVSTTDTENYDRSYRLNGDRWVDVR